jgi:hypothetical protein
MACRCYKITQGSSGPCTTIYYDCNNTSQILETPQNGSNTLCISSIDSTACDSVSIVASCYNGVCLTGTTEQLIYNLLTKLGPCPSICEGDNIQFGGPTGMAYNDIKSGLRLNSNAESILPTPPPVPESSGTIVFNGEDPTTTGSYVAAPQPTLSTWLPGSGDFTIEWFQKMDLANSGSFPRVFSIGPDTGPTLGLSIEGGTAYVWPGPHVSGTIPVTYDGAWVHFAISYNSAIDGGNISLFINGDNVGNNTMLGLDITDAIQELYIGSDGLSPNDGWAGNITNFRWTNSVVYPVSATTITVPTSPLTVLPDTKLLLLGGSISNPVSDSTGINTLNYSNITWSADTPF